MDNLKMEDNREIGSDELQLEGNLDHQEGNFGILLEEDSLRLADFQQEDGLPLVLVDIHLSDYLLEQVGILLVHL
jgi:hypothetical protein